MLCGEEICDMDISGDNKNMFEEDKSEKGNISDLFDENQNQTLCISAFSPINPQKDSSCSSLPQPQVLRPPPFLPNFPLLSSTIEAGREQSDNIVEQDRHQDREQKQQKSDKNRG